MQKKALHPQDIIQKMAVHVSMCMQTKCRQMQKDMGSCKTYLLSEQTRVLLNNWTSTVANEQHWGNKLMYIFFTTEVATVKSATNAVFFFQHNTTTTTTKMRWGVRLLAVTHMSTLADAVTIRKGGKMCKQPFVVLPENELWHGHYKVQNAKY